MPRVLIPSDNPDFPYYLAQAYHRAGWDAAVGRANFEIGAANYDLVHLQWPEELCRWQPPDEAGLKEVIARLDTWGATAPLVLTVHNLEPHRQGDHPNYHRLYEAVYRRTQVIAHFTETSRDLALKKFPTDDAARHIVTGYFSLNHLRMPDVDAAALRRAAGFAPEDFVLLIFGGLREWDEVQLLRRAFDQAKVPGKRITMAGRYDEGGPVWRQRWRRWSFGRWLRQRRAQLTTGYLPDAQLHRVAEAVDAVVLPRFRALNSGLPALGASFGKIIIYPECGAYPELLGGTQNPSYRPGDAASLAAAIETAARLNRATVAQENRRLAESWDWDQMVARILAALPAREAT